MTLEPLEPAKGVEMFCADLATERADATINAYNYRLGHFTRWCDIEDIANLNVLTGRLLHEYRLWRRDDGDLNRVSEKTQMDTLRVFIKWLESIDAVEQDLATKVRSPSLSDDDNVRDDVLEADRSKKILDYLTKYEYASLPHVTLLLLCHTMMRTGGVRALDVDDHDASNSSIEVLHREETPIKNKSRGERFIALSDSVNGVLIDWIEDRRPNVTDEFGREPLLASTAGRLHKSTIRKYSYQYTRPCIISGECPHGRAPESCEARNDSQAYKCPSSRSPHAIRRGKITYNLEQKKPEKFISDRENVSLEILSKHYDARDKLTKMEQRRDFVDDY